MVMRRCAYLEANIYSFTNLDGCNFELKACMKDLVQYIGLFWYTIQIEANVLVYERPSDHMNHQYFLVWDSEPI